MGGWAYAAWLLYIDRLKKILPETSLVTMVKGFLKGTPPTQVVEIKVVYLCLVMVVMVFNTLVVIYII